MSTDTTPLRLELRGISKRFPGVLANDAVDLAVPAGEIHALLGENGAGKSTLVKIVNGVLRPDAGTILWEGVPTVVDGPKAARALGIGMVYQHFSLFEALTVTENVALGISRAERHDLEARIAAVAESYGLPLDPRRTVHGLSVGERQRVEIVRCLLQQPKLLIMDEPTSVLTPQECDGLFETLHRLAGEGCSVLYISHKLHEIRTLCHAATVLRGGRVVASCDPQHETPASLARMMIGEDVEHPARTRAETGRPRLVVDGLDAPTAERFGTSLVGVSFEVRGGEILGIAGVAGNGQRELLRLLAGEQLAATPETIRIDERPAGRLGPRARRSLGLACIPEDRIGHGAVPAMSLTENAFLSGFGPLGLTYLGLVRTGARDRYASEICDGFAVKTRGIETLARNLSGGNLQRFITGREVLQEPAVLAASNPTWGVDAGAAAAIHAAFLALARTGAAVVVISQELDELLAISDRIAVMAGGRLSPAEPVERVTPESLGLLMAGDGQQEAPTARA